MPVASAATTQRVPSFMGGGRIGWRDRSVPTPGRGELLLRVRANALCGTDRAQLEGGSLVTPGHEIAGEVAMAGPDTSTDEGAQGVVYLMDYCGSCRQCVYGATNQCLAKRADMGFTHAGGYGQFVLAHETNFFALDAALSPAESTLLLDVLGTTSHALRRARSVRDDISSLVVAGVGPVGLGMVAISRLLLGYQLPILALDVLPYRLELAKRLGALPVDLRTERLDERMRSLGLTDGADAAVDTSGQANARRILLDTLGHRGVLVCLGHGDDLRLSVSADLIAPERTVMGSEYFRYDELPRTLDLLLKHRAYLGQIITHRFPVEKLEEAYALFMAGQTGKVVVEQ